MAPSGWQKQHIHFQKIVWAVSGVTSGLLIILLLVLGYRVEVAGIFFLVLFAFLRVVLAVIFKDRMANSLVRLLKFDYEEIERDIRMVFKNKGIRFYRRVEEDVYRYEFPGRNLSMIAQPYWISLERARPYTKLTLYKLTAKNEAFAEMLAEAIDEMEELRSSGEAE
jgi:hypothetical protein